MSTVAGILLTLAVIAMGATVLALFAGVFTMTKGGEFNKRWGNHLMRARVALQGLAVVLLLLFVILAVA